MAYQLNGVDQYMRFSIGALSAAGAGPMTMVALVRLDATTDGAIIHLLTSGNASCAFLEIFGNFDYGTGASARAWSSTGAVGNWWIVIASKQSGTASVEYTVIPLGGSPTSGTASGGTLGDGSLPGAAGVIQLGRFQTSGTEYVFGQYAAVAIWTSYMNQAAREALTSWNAWVAAAPQWYTRFDGIGTRSDLSGNGGNETGRFGTAAITLTADPAGFFPGGGSDVTVNDTSGGSIGGRSAETVQQGVVLTDMSGGSISGRSPDTVQQGVVIVDASGGTGSGRSSDTVVQGVVVQDASGGSIGGSTATPTPVVGVVLTDTSGGSLAGSSGSTVAAGIVLADTSGGTVGGRSADTEGAATIVADGSGGSGSGSSRETVVSAVLVQDSSGGSGSGSSAGAVLAGVLVVDASGGSIGGRSTDLVIIPTDVTIQDTSGATGSGSSADTADTSEVVHDTMIMPVMMSALTCMQEELAKVETPPLIYTLRPGADMEPSADPGLDECCAGVAWVRMVSSYESDSSEYPEPTTRPASNGCGPDSWAVVLEVGVYRCVPVAGNTKGAVVTPAQWLAATQAQMDDGAALRRVLCCLRDIYDTADVTSGQVNPLPIQANCGGISLQITLRRDACDC